MCGIIGAVSTKDITATLLEGLSRLEYRGYDSAGITIINNENRFQRIRTCGKVTELKKITQTNELSGKTGIAHTRWATHGRPTESNAHPHIVNNQIALVHNGIIENYKNLRTYLLSKGCVLTSDTDSELVAHLVFLKIQEGYDFLSAVQITRKELKGAYAFAFIDILEPNHLIAVRNGCPLVVGLNDKQNFVASDTLALLPFTQRFIYLNENDLVDLFVDHYIIYDSEDRVVNRTVHISQEKDNVISKKNYPHFMLKEIYEQPNVLVNTMQGRITHEKVLVEAFGIDAKQIFKRVKRIEIVACGTSYHSGLIGKYWIEEIGNVPCQVEIASENRYRKKIVEENTLFLTLSQSGETADTIAALRVAKLNPNYLASLAICNVAGSSLVRESDFVFMTEAGPEIGVASTKSFTSQLIALFILSLSLARYNNLSIEKENYYLQLLKKIPEQIKHILSLDPLIKKISEFFIHKEHTMFLGRGIQFPIAMEGALKLKEISYIHAEAYPGGELKHGPLALIDKNMPVIAIAPYDDLIEKMKSNLEEVKARDGNLFILTDTANTFDDLKSQIINLPTVDRLLSPFIYIIPLQLLAYHVGVYKGINIDQPRNLAKSVTVE